MKTEIDGIVPVMLTPFNEKGDIDYSSLENFIEWYFSNGAAALFAVCQSSEMQKLTLKERVALSSFVVEKTGGRVPVIASGHISSNIEGQLEELVAIAGTGVDAVVLVTNRLDEKSSGYAAFKHNLMLFLDHLPSDMHLGLYECPAPFRRLLSDDEIKLCRDTGRFIVLKDVSCDLETIKRRVKLVEGTGFNIVNANAAIALDAMRAGSRGFAGVFTNFHPDLYAWLYDNKYSNDPLVDEVSTFLALSACAESMGYPGIAKLFHKRLGTIETSCSRVIEYDLIERHWAIEKILDHIHEGSMRYREKTGI